MKTKKIKAEAIVSISIDDLAWRTAYAYSQLPVRLLEEGREQLSPLFAKGYWRIGTPRKNSIAWNEGLGRCMLASPDASVWPERGEPKGGEAYPRLFGERGHRFVAFALHPAYKDFTGRELSETFHKSSIYACHLCDNKRCGNHKHIVLGDSKLNAQHRWRDANVAWAKESPEALAIRMRRWLHDAKRVDAVTYAKLEQLMTHWKPNLGKAKAIAQLTGIHQYTIEAVIKGSAVVFNPKTQGQQRLLNLK